MLWSRPQTSSSDWTNKASELVWTFLQSWVISLTAVFLWKTQRSAPTNVVKPPWKAPPSHAGTCENILETGYKERKTCSETPGQPTAVHPRESTLVSTLGCSFSRRPVPPRPHYFWKSRVAEVPEADGPRGAASRALSELRHYMRSRSTESSSASVDHFSLLYLIDFFKSEHSKPLCSRFKCQLDTKSMGAGGGGRRLCLLIFPWRLFLRRKKQFTNPPQNNLVPKSKSWKFFLLLF